MYYIYLNLNNIRIISNRNYSFFWIIIIFSLTGYNITVKQGELNMNVDYKAVGTRIRQIRLEQHLTQEALAEEIGISTSHVSNIETGTKQISLSTLIKVANILKVSVDELLIDNVMHSNTKYEKEIMRHLEDCSDYELRHMIDLIIAAKVSIRKNIELKKKFENN